MTPLTHPDDDPRFAEWIRDIGPLRDMPPPGRDPLAITVSLLGGALTAALAWIITYAAGYTAWNSTAIALTIVILTGLCLHRPTPT